MPSRSPEQARFMRAVAKSKKFAKKVGVSQSVGAKFMKADKKKRRSKHHYQIGGSTRMPDELETRLGPQAAPPLAPPPRNLPRGMRSTGSFRSSPDAGAQGRNILSALGNVGAGVLGIKGGIGGRAGRAAAEGAGREGPMGFTAEEVKKTRKKRKRKGRGRPGTKSYYHGGKIRGCGKETQGRRKAKMVRMKGS